jgi:NADP-dependent 3-hydroxy acid dehydrogenase YdfG
VSAFVRQVERESRHILHLVSAAGFFKPVSFLECNAEDYDLQMDINKSLFFITQAVAKNMTSHGGRSNRKCFAGL